MRHARTVAAWRGRVRGRTSLAAGDQQAGPALAHDVLHVVQDAPRAPAMQQSPEWQKVPKAPKTVPLYKKTPVPL